MKYLVIPELFIGYEYIGSTEKYCHDGPEIKPITYLAYRDLEISTEFAHLLASGSGPWEFRILPVRLVHKLGIYLLIMAFEEMVGKQLAPRIIEEEKYEKD